MEKTILVVDDEFEIREIIGELLASVGYQIESAEDGGAALEIVGKGGIDCIISDIKMPRMDGIEFVAKLRKLDENVPVMFCTALCPSLKDETMLAGISNILLKPIDFNELKMAVEVALAKDSNNFESVNKVLDDWEKLIV
jgi:CheY-like chemotaxis protein